MNIDSRRLAVLLAVSRTGGVLAAADVLGISPSAVSQQIGRLEAETGVRVLDRLPGGSALTPAGRILADAAERVESSLGEARRALAALENPVAGTVVVGSIQSVIRAILVPILAGLGQSLPGVDLVVREVAEEHGRRALRRGELDLLVIEHDVSATIQVPAGTRDVPLFNEPWVVVSPGNEPRPQSLMDLAQATWIGPEPGSATHRAMQRLAEELGFTPRTRHLYIDFDVALAMVASGLGVALMPSLALIRDLPRNVQVVELAGLGTRRLFLRHRVNRNEPRAATLAVMDQILQAAASLRAE